MPDIIELSIAKVCDEEIVVVAVVEVDVEAVDVVAVVVVDVVVEVVPEPGACLIASPIISQSCDDCNEKLAGKLDCGEKTIWYSPNGMLL